MKRKPSYPCKHEASMKNRGDFMGKLGSSRVSLCSLLPRLEEGPCPSHMYNFTLFFLKMATQFYKVRVTHTYIYPQ